MSYDEATLADIAAWCKARAREGAEAVHAQAAGIESRKPRLTDAESAAIARAKIDRSTP